MKLISTTRKLLPLGLCLLYGLAAAGTHPIGPPCVAGEPGRGGTIQEFSRHRDTNFIVHITDLNGDDLFTVPLAGRNVPGGSAATYVQPPGVPGVCDAWNETILPPRAGGGAGGGAWAGLFFESFVLDPDTGQYVMHDVFDTFPALGYTRFPDFYMDANRDGIADNDGVLYSLINLADFDAFPSFAFGDSIEVVGGVNSFFDIFFSITRPTFDPVTGWTGTPYTGAAVVETEHSVPEPGSLGLGLAALSLLMVAKRKGGAGR